jgi:Response regulator of the LytR/AlgR family
MKIRIEKNQDFDREPEVIIRCREVDANVHKILSQLEEPQKKLIGYENHKEYVINPYDVLYCESVDGIVFIYVEERVYRTSYTLNDMEASFSKLSFFRCSKSMVININSIKSLKSELGNRIDARLSNGEHIIISRHYAKQFRSILKEAGSL